MALANAIKGGTRPSQTITWTREDGTAEDLSGATLTGFIRNQRTGVTQAIAGTLTVTTPASGIFTWVYDPTDIATAGAFDVQFVATFAAAPTIAKTVTAEWIVKIGLSVP